MVATSARARAASREVGEHLAAEQLDRIVHLGDAVGHEEHPGKGRDPGRLVGADALGDLLGASDQVALLEAARLLAQRRALERLQMLVQLGGMEAAERLLAR